MSAMISVEEALARVLASAATPLEEERVALEAAYGRVLARDIRAARMPAIRAAPITSPFLASPARIAARVEAAMRTCPSAAAARRVGSLSDTSTMRASPEAPIWVSAFVSLAEETMG